MARQVRNGGAAASSSRGLPGGTGVSPPTSGPPPAARQQVREQAVGARDPGRQLPEEREARVDERALAVPGPQQAAAERLLAGIVHGEGGLVLRVPLAGEVEAPLLDPPLEVEA